MPTGGIRQRARRAHLLFCLSPTQLTHHPPRRHPPTSQVAMVLKVSTHGVLPTPKTEFELRAKQNNEFNFFKMLKKHSNIAEKNSFSDFEAGSRNWLLHARFVRGEHAVCMELADKMQREHDNAHRFAHYVKGLVLAEAGRIQNALEKFHSCIRLQPQDPEPVKQVAKCLYRQGRYRLSMEAYHEADKLAKHPDPDIYASLAECAWNLGEVPKGIEYARSAVQAGGGERAGSLLARLLMANDELEAAMQAYDDVMISTACSADTLAAAGALRLRAGDPRRAFQLLGSALALNPLQHAAALALAAMMLQHKDVDAALSRLKGALTAHPTCVAAHADLGLALLAKKKHVAALTCLQRSAWTAPLSARASHDLGLALLVCRRPASAFCRLATAAALQPSQAHTVLLIAIVLERLQDPRADVAYARATVMAPADPLVRLNLAGRHARVGKLVEAAEEAGVTEMLLKQQPRPDQQLARALATFIGLLKEANSEIEQITTQSVEVASAPLPDEATDEGQHKMAADEV